jgi:hypothetical protein
MEDVLRETLTLYKTKQSLFLLNTLGSVHKNNSS